MVHDEGPVGLEGVRVNFDDDRVVSDAGIALVATLAGRLGIEGLVTRFVWLCRDRPGAANAGRMAAKLREVKTELMRRRNLPIPEQGRWLGSVVRGHLAYYAVPGNIDMVVAFRTPATPHWYRALRRRSQRTRLNWERMNRLSTR